MVKHMLLGPGSVIHHRSVVGPKNLDTNESNSQAELVLLARGWCLENHCCKREQWPETRPGV